MEFSQRVLRPELMDDPSCSPDEFRRCLEDLATVNRLTLAYRPTLRFLRDALARMPPDSGTPGRPVRLLDVGGGYGDALRRIDRWAARRGIVLEMTSLDLSPAARLAAAPQPPTRVPIRWVTADVFGYEPDAPPDLVISSLFTHHLDDEGVVRFLRWMEMHARWGWFTNDLHRHPVPFHLFRALATLARWHRFVRHDGPVSIGRSFTRADWTVLLERAGLARQAEIAWWMPFRLAVSRLRARAAS